MQVTFQTTFEDYQAFERAVKATPLRGLGTFALFVVSCQIAAAALNSDLRMRLEIEGWKVLAPQMWALVGTLAFFAFIVPVTLKLHKHA